jgi:hypothetical protein
MNQHAELLLRSARLYSASDIRSRPCPVPAQSDVYAFYFDGPPSGIITEGYHRTHQHALLYVGIAQKPDGWVSFVSGTRCGNEA